MPADNFRKFREIYLVLAVMIMSLHLWSIFSVTNILSSMSDWEKKVDFILQLSWMDSDVTVSPPPPFLGSEKVRNMFSVTNLYLTSFYFQYCLLLLNNNWPSNMLPHMYMGISPLYNHSSFTTYPMHLSISDVSMSSSGVLVLE